MVEAIMKRKSNLSSSRVEPDRIGRMGGKRRGEASVNSQLARRLQGFKGRTRNRFGGGKSSGSSRYDRRQRVVVKAMVSRHRAGKARDSLRRHAAYLGRESASADGKSGVFYDAARDVVNAKTEVSAWTDDRHHFRLIVSPEHGADIPDMTAYIRKVMRRVQRDLETPLTWVAVNHHNTDNPHAHLVLRGRKADGTDLVIPRHYIAYGIRDRACEVATEFLGERSVREVQQARAKEVTAERFTSLDRMIERHLKDGAINVAPAQRIGFAPEDRKLVIGRLQFLESIDLAHKGRGTRWEVTGEFKDALRELGARNDIIHQLYRNMGNEAGRVQRMNAAGAPSTPVVGVVIAKGSVDEISEDRFVVIRDAAGTAHYGRVRDGAAYHAVQAGSIAELGAGAQQRRAVTEQIVAVATLNKDVYSTESHAMYLRAKEPGLEEQQVGKAVRSATARLTFVAGHEGSGVRAGESPDRYDIDVPTFERFSRGGARRTDLRAVTEHTLAEQIAAKAATWLDRQAFGERRDDRLAGHPAVREAIEKRGAWLVEKGLAERATDGSGTIRPNPGALRDLAAAERMALAERLADKYGRPVAELPQGGTVTGIYRGTEQLHAGRRGIVTTDDAVYVAPVRQMPGTARGNEVTMHRRGFRDTAIEPVSGPTLDARTHATLDGLEAGR
jgi:type IV secretory pathway VirD2 relaxase